MNNNVYRKYLAGILAASAVVMMAFSGCGGAAKTDSANTDSAATEAVSEEATDDTEEVADDTSPADYGVPEAAETTDGIYSTYLRASDRDLIGKLDDDDMLYVIAYDTSAEGNKLLVFGSMNYKNVREQDPISVSDDEKHVFDVTDDTEFSLSGGVEDPRIVTADEFAKQLQEQSDSGLYLELEVSGGVVVKAMIAS